jgi:hypothetical protein
MVYLKRIKELVWKFIDNNIDEFEFIIDLNNIDYWEIDFENKEINITECCIVFIREYDDEGLDKLLVDNNWGEKIKDENIIYYIM